MSKKAPRTNRKVLIAVPLVWCAVAGLQAAAAADDGGTQADAGADGSVGPTPGNGTCSVAGERSPFGTSLGAGCC